MRLMREAAGVVKRRMSRVTCSMRGVATLQFLRGCSHCEHMILHTAEPTAISGV